MESTIILIDPQQAIEDSKTRKDIVKTMMVQEILRAGADYGVIPGTSKPTLLKPGAERLCSAFHLDPVFETLTSIEHWGDDGSEPLFFYRIRCRLIHIETGLEIATGVGSCNSRESKYRWRQQNRACPKCGKEAIIAGKQEYGGGWLCFAKKGGCGAKFGENDPQIVSQPIGQVLNDDVFSIVNTIDKMACKRALIAAVLIGANASEFFTQDIEDMPGFGVMTEPVSTGNEPNAGENAPVKQQPPASGEKPPPPMVNAKTTPTAPETLYALYAALSIEGKKRVYRIMDAASNMLCRTTDAKVFEPFEYDALKWQSGQRYRLANDPVALAADSGVFVRWLDLSAEGSNKVDLSEIPF